MIERGEGTRSPLTASKHPTTGIETHMNKFKVGDTVVSLKSYNGQFTRGKEYTVTDAYSDRVLVALDDAGSTTNGWLASNFKLARKRYAAENDHVVMLCENGNYKPALDPRVYGREQAIKVAKVMAKKHGGKFVVFKAVAHAIAPENPEPMVIEFN